MFAYDQSRVTLTNTCIPFDRGFVVPSAATPQIDLNMTVSCGYAVNIAGTQLVDFWGTLFTGPRLPAMRPVAPTQATPAGT